VNFRSSNSFITTRPNRIKQAIYYNNIIARTFNKGYYNNILEFTLGYRIKPNKKKLTKKHKIIVSITGASGSIYAKVLLDKLSKLSEQIEQVGIVMSDNAKDVWKHELGNEDYKNYTQLYLLR
jgi:hypothetical protein